MLLKSKRALGIILVLMILIGLVPAQLAVAAPKARSVEISETSITIDLATQAIYQIEAKVLPEGASQRMIYASQKTAVAKVSKTGLITAKKIGNTKIGIRPHGVKKWKKISLKVVDSLRPTKLTVPSTKVNLQLGEMYDVIPTVTPSTAIQDVTYSVDKPAIASVSTTGTITAKKSGTCYVRVRSKRNTNLVRNIKVTVGKLPTPSKIIIVPEDKAMTVNESLQLTAQVAPDGASESVIWKSNNTKLATVTSNGLVSAIAEGSVKITATSRAKSTVKTTRTINISDPNKPTAIAFTNDDVLYFPKKSTYTLEWTVAPESARRDAKFTSSNSSIVSVDANTGFITMKDDGVVTITMTAVGTKLTDTIKIVVLNTQRTSELPDKYSSSDSQIKENLAKIDAIRTSAFNELTMLEGIGTISPAESKRRREAITDAFVGYGFAWKTPVKVTYWDSSLSQNNYQPGRIYYGLPYIQHGANMNYTNRQFNLTKAVGQQYFKSINGSSRYYEMTSKRLNKYYVGVDCSSFVSMAVYGTNHAASYYNTEMIGKSTYYKTVTGSTNMRPGDLMNRSGRHVIMFLYYIDSAKTQMMLIENGGGSVSCKVANVSTYTSQGYVIKRPTKY